MKIGNALFVFFRLYAFHRRGGRGHMISVRLSARALNVSA